MPPVVLTLLKVVLLGLLYVFVWYAVRGVALEVAGRRRRIEPAKEPAPAPPAARALRLEVREPELPPRSVALEGVVEVGRGDVSHPLRDGFASQRHARFERVDGAWTVTDLGSTNGTFLNEERIDGPRRLRPGDTVRVGNTLLEVRA